MKEQPFLYQQVPRCGNGSFSHALSQHLDLVSDKPTSLTCADHLTAFASWQPKIANLKSNTVVQGPFIFDGTRPPFRYPSFVTNRRLLTVVREPLERALSAYFLRRQPRELLRNFLERQKNSMARYLFGSEASRWREFLEHYFHIGVTEELQLSMDVFASKISQPPVRVQRHHAVTRPRYDIAPDLMTTFVDRNAIDYEIYRYAKKRLSRENAIKASEGSRSRAFCPK